MIKALRNRILVKKEAEADINPGGMIIIPENVKVPPTRAKVLDVGPGMLSPAGVFIKTTLKVGQIVLLPRYCGTEVTHEGEKLSLVNEDEILGVFSGKKV